MRESDEWGKSGELREIDGLRESGDLREIRWSITSGSELTDAHRGPMPPTSKLADTASEHQSAGYFA